MKRFLEGAFAGSYEKQLIAEFEKLLPETPPWKSGRRGLELAKCPA